MPGLISRCGGGSVPTAFERCTGVSSAAVSVPKNVFAAFTWTHEAGSSLLSLITNRPEVLVTGLYQVSFYCKTGVTMASGAEFQAYSRAWSTPWGDPPGTFNVGFEVENRCYANGVVAGQRLSVTTVPWWMNDDADNGGAGADFFDFNLFHTDPTPMPKLQVTGEIYVVYFKPSAA